MVIRNVMLINTTITFYRSNSRELTLNTVTAALKIVVTYQKIVEQN